MNISLNKVFYILGPVYKKKLILLSLLMIISVFLEMVSFYIFIPLVKIFQNPETINIYLLKAGLRKINLKNYSYFNIIKVCLFFVFLIMFIKTIYSAFLFYIQSKFTTSYSAHIAEKLFDGYLNLGYSFHLNQNSSFLLRNIQLENLQLLELVKAFLTLCVEISVVISIIIVILFYEPLGALSIFIFIVIAVIIYNLLTKKHIIEWGKNRQIVDGQLNKNLLEGLNGIKEIKIYKLENFISNKFKIINNERSVILTQLLTFEKIPRIYLEFLGFTSLILFILYSYATYHSLDKIILIVGVFSLGFLRILPSINRIIASIQQVRFSLPVIELMYNEFHTIEKQSNKRLINQPSILNEHEIYSKSDSLIIENISFKYSEKNEYVLQDVNIKLKKNTITGIIGHSGSGKSTLVNLISGILLCTKGYIYLDSKDANNESKEYNLDQLIGYVPQSQFLTDDTILNNITYSDLYNEINHELLHSVLIDSQLDRLIETLPDGLNTIVGERGIKLSGGQIQRIGIARALYRNSKILIFDEATSALDNKTEEIFIDVIEKLKNDKIIIIITHRLAPLKCCESIYKIENKNLVKQTLPI